jgi:hypothetical protein
MTATERRFYLRWVLANAAGEALGLGATAALTGATFWALSRTGRGDSPPLVLLGASVCVLAGALVEGGAVGGLQGGVLCDALPALSRRDWVRATVRGAGVAWTLGMLPSTLMSLLSPTAAHAGGMPSSASAVPAPADPMDGPIKYLLAAVMGLLLGPVLAVFQTGPLRRAGIPARAARRWLPTNAAAWALGMPVIFAATDLVGPGTPPAVIVFAVALALVAAGAAVGAVHGLALLRIVREVQGTGAAAAK